MNISVLSKIIAFCRRHVELVAIIPGILAVLAAGWWLTWSRGVAVLEIGPIIVDYAVGLLAVSGLGYLTWAFRREYWYDLGEDDEARLHAAAERGERGAWFVIIKDRVEFLALFGLLLLAFSQFAGAQPVAESHRLAADLITRWEVGGERGYMRCCVAPIWPGGASGVTWGIGYDGGHQPAQVIRDEWAIHPERELLATTSSRTGADARTALPDYRHVITPYPCATNVMLRYSLPRYAGIARRTYGRAFDAAPAGIQAALISEVYNRGPAMAGNRRTERRRIRDVCLPSGDAQCVAAQLRASCRVWIGSSLYDGLCARRRDEAKTAAQ